MKKKTETMDNMPELYQKAVQGWEVSTDIFNLPKKEEKKFLGDVRHLPSYFYMGIPEKAKKNTISFCFLDPLDLLQPESPIPDLGVALGYFSGVKSIFTAFENRWSGVGIYTEDTSPLKIQYYKEVCWDLGMSMVALFNTPDGAKKIVETDAPYAAFWPWNDFLKPLQYQKKDYLNIFPKEMLVYQLTPCTEGATPAFLESL